ncbi:hypothetical protein NliqN6_3972 [Naganishia liquefaciens]|uniref:Uncharacterized protein n=1 Tax=Naganishia liquefaciens TaxID=104408 RepID=A0A8H3TVN6_9TREE|nr:hypothetical protein NliqN6_3972 [Naganishia liquefaciens]
MEAFGLPTSFGRAKPVNKNAQSSTANPQNNSNNRGGRKGNPNVRTSPYPPQGSAAGDTEQSERSFGSGRGRGRGRGGGNHRGRGGARGRDDARGPPPGQRTGFSAEETETGKAFYSESFFENPWAALEAKS